MIAEQMTDQNHYLAFASLTCSTDPSLATALAAAPLKLAKRKANKRPALGLEKNMLEFGLKFGLKFGWEPPLTRERSEKTVTIKYWLALKVAMINEKSASNFAIFIKQKHSNSNNKQERRKKVEKHT